VGADFCLDKDDCDNTADFAGDIIDCFCG